MSYFVRILVLGLVLAVVCLAMALFIQRAPEAIPEYTVMPARFEGEGAFTMGCALWDPLQVRAYDKDNQNEGFAAVTFGRDPAGDYSLFAVVDGPRGTTAISGKKCAVSIDWSWFPKEARPVP